VNYGPSYRIDVLPRRKEDIRFLPVNMGLWFYAINGLAMKTTVELSDDLYRRAKAEAALRERHARF
jgi:hypothetical protein